MAIVMYTNYQPFLDNISNTTDNQLVALIQQTSLATNFLPGTLMLIAIIVILFVIMKSRGVPTSSAFLASAFANMILTIIAFPLGILHGTYFYISLILPPIALLLLYMFK